MATKTTFSRMSSLAVQASVRLWSRVKLVENTFGPNIPLAVCGRLISGGSGGLGLGAACKPRQPAQPPTRGWVLLAWSRLDIASPGLG
jgi:hypothetical protein